MKTCTAAEDSCRYCGSNEIVLWPLDIAGKCATCSWQAHSGRSAAARMQDVLRRVEQERYAAQGIHASIPMPRRRSHYRIRDSRPLVQGGGGRA